MSQDHFQSPLFSRRSVLRGAAIVATTAAVSSAATRPAEADDNSGLHTLDVQSLQEADLADPAQALNAYGWLQAIATVQGLVNRSGPRLFLDFLAGDERGELRIDNYWLQATQRAGWAAVASPVSVADIPAAVATFRSALKGAVVWDPSVPATSNVASTVAGADGLLALPYDPNPDSAYSNLVDPTGEDASKLAVRVWLIQPDGSPLFTGSGHVPGSRRASSGSAKADAYWWALEHYLAAGKSNPTQLAYFLDAYWLKDVGARDWPHPLQNTLLSNHDYLVAKRGFIFDLSPWDDAAPDDDPNQPVGADFEVLTAILKTAGSLSGRRFGAIRGFVPWRYKYSSSAGGNTWQLAGNAEWSVVKLAASHGFYLDADAEGLDPMANASMFQHYSVNRTYPPAPTPTLARLKKAGYMADDGSVAAKRYVMIYTGDFDSAAWAYHMLPRVWDDTSRGQIPLNWAFDPHIAERMPFALVHVHETASPLDYFIAGDAGAGYVSPGALTAPEAQRGDLLELWTRRNLTAYRRWGLDTTGFIIDGVSQPLTDPDAVASYGQFSPVGVVTSSSDPYGMQGLTPFVRMGNDLDGLSTFVSQLNREDYETAATAAPLRPQFEVARTVLKDPSWHKSLMASFSPDAPPPVLDGPTTVSVELGDPNVDDGLTQSDAPDGQTKIVTADGVTARSTAPGVGGNRYLYFDVDNSIIDGGPVAAKIAITYLDIGTDTFNIQYDGTDPFSGGPSVTRQGTGQWKTTSVSVADANFASREQGQYDFRLEVPAGTDDLVVSRIVVTMTPPSDYRGSQVEFLDAPTFFALLSRHLSNDLVVDCSAGSLSPGQATNVVFRLRNFTNHAVTKTVHLAAPTGAIVDGPSNITVAPRTAKRLAYTVNAGTSTSDRELILNVGGREWRFIPTYQANSYTSVRTVETTLGPTDRSAGITRLELGFDGTTVSGSTAGRSWRASDMKNNGFTREGYLYFDIDDTYTADLDGGHAAVEVDYLDDPGIHFRVDYDGQDHQRMLDGVLTPTRTVRTSGTSSWQTATFDLTDIRFANRIPGSPDGRAKGVADFRVASDKPVRLGAVRLTVP